MLKLKSILLSHGALPGGALVALWLSLIALVLSPSFTLRAQPAAPNRVLELDGTNSYVELPPDVFEDLTQATVEGWVKWDSFRDWSRFFDFGTYGSSMNVANSGTSAELAFVCVQPPTARFHQVQAAGLLKPNLWCHIAAVTGPAGMKLYFNGVLVGANP